MTTLKSWPSLDGPSKMGNCQVSGPVYNGYIPLNHVASNVKVHHTLLVHRLRDRDEGRVQQATEMAEAARIANVPDPQTTDDDGKDMTIAKALQDGPSLRKIVLGDKTFLAAMQDGYKNDSVFSKVVNNPCQHIPNLCEQEFFTCLNTRQSMQPLQ